MNDLPAVIAEWHYCPCCSGTLHMHGEGLVCQQCGHIQYPFHSVAACVLLEAEGCLLVVDRLRDPHRGALDIPGGFVKPGERAEDAARRELAEETGIELVAALDLVAVLPDEYGGPNKPTQSVFYTAQLPTQLAAVAADDAGNPRWLVVETVDSLQFGFPCVQEAFRIWRAGHR